MTEQDDPVRELKERAEEMSPHQRAFGAVLDLWGVLSVAGSIIGALILATWITWWGGAYQGVGVLLLTYFVIAAPTAALLHHGQTGLRKNIARKILRNLDAPVRRALSGTESSAAFQSGRDDDERR